MELDTALAVAEQEAAGEQNMELTALSPSELLAAQTHLVTWCDTKVKAVRAELNEYRENLSIAKKNGWRTSGLTRAVATAEKRIAYYEKIKIALAAGYLIVPNFPVDLFAVRVSRARPQQTVYNSRWARHQTPPDQLPAGEGRYVSNETVQRDESYTKNEPSGGKTEVICLVDDAFADVAFPVQAVKPVIMDATQRAMALRVFDQLGVVHNQGSIATARRGDPIVVGQILDPRGNGRGVTFFVAWWLNTAAL